MTTLKRIAHRIREALRVAVLIVVAVVTGYAGAKFVEDDTMHDVARGEAK